MPINLREREKNMIKITSDTGSLYNIESGKKIGVDIAPLNVTIAGKTYREFEEISSKEFYDLIMEGNLPLSSQPAMGEVLDIFEKYANEDIDIINICMADGLSGTYQTACAAKEQVSNSSRVHVINSRTLCGPELFLVDLAVKMANEGKKLQEILDKLNHCIDNCVSFLMPQDFDYLKRNGRLTPIAATLGGLLKIQPIVTQTKDGTRLDKFGMGRTFTKAVEKIIKEMNARKIDASHITYVSHAFAKAQADKAMEMLKKAFPSMELVMLELSPAFITQGGPHCIAIQSIIK